MSYSVVGRDLRKKRRLNKAPMGPAARRIQVEDESTEDIELANFEGEIRKEDVFKFYKLPWPRDSERLLSLSQGRPVMMRRLQELDLSVSPSQPETPKYGNCMMHSLYDQLQFDQYQKSFAMSSQQLRQKMTTRMTILP